MTTSPDSEKRIPKSLDTDTSLIGGYALSDLAVAVGPAVGLIVLTRTVLPTAPTVFGVHATIPAVLVLLLIGVVLVTLTPAHAGSLAWLRRLFRFAVSKRRLPHATARRHTRVSRLRSEYNAIERTDGGLIGAVRVDPVSMALASEQDWSRKAEGFADVLNTAVDFPIQLYSTTRPVPIDDHLSRYEDRLDDPDVANNPQLQTLIEDYVQWAASQHKRQQASVREHYVIIAVTPREIRVEGGGLRSWVGKCERFGSLWNGLLGPSEAAVREAMGTELAERSRRVVRGLSGIDGLAAHRVEAVTVGTVVEEFWVDTDLDTHDSQRYRKTPIVTGENR
ncbi:MAG: hypothetical protein ABEH64_13515 [Salinirussus sp.]